MSDRYRPYDCLQGQLTKAYAQELAGPFRASFKQAIRSENTSAKNIEKYVVSGRRPESLHTRSGLVHYVRRQVGSGRNRKPSNLSLWTGRPPEVHLRKR
jgi:hypothetical protein